MNARTIPAPLFKTASMAIALIAITTGCREQKPNHSVLFPQNTVEAAADQLREMVERDNLYPWTTIERLAFYTWKITDEFVHVQISEIHLGDDGADSKTHPTVGFFKLDRESGQWWVTWPAPGEGWISYVDYAYLRHTGGQNEMGAKQSEPISSPCGKYHAFLRRFGLHLPPGFRMDEGQNINPYAYLIIKHQEEDSVAIAWKRESRGVSFSADPLDAYGGSLVPNNLQWDSTGRYLYYEFDGGSAAAAVWRVDPKLGTPRYVSATREPFGLMSQSQGADWVICNQVREGQWLWFAYTPEDIESDTHTFSTHHVSWTP